MSNAARERGCTGAVVDGGLRDTSFVLKMGFPVFYRFRCSASSIGRWEIREWMVPIKIGETTIQPDDFIFGDVDGVVVIPKDLTEEVLVKTEIVVERENKMRVELSQGVTVSEVYRKHGKF
jgi:regulator of RNase E activity RraA